MQPATDAEKRSGILGYTSDAREFGIIVDAINDPEFVRSYQFSEEYADELRQRIAGQTSISQLDYPTTMNVSNPMVEIASYDYRMPIYIRDKELLYAAAKRVMFAEKPLQRIMNKVTRRNRAALGIMAFYNSH